MTREEIEAKKIRDVIDSCLTYEQLLVTQSWIRRIWDDVELILFADKRIEHRELEIAKINDNTPIDISTKGRIH